MEYINWIQREWNNIANAPFIYAVTIVIAVFATVIITKSILGGEAAAAKERSEYLKQKITDLEGEKSALMSKLESYGEDIIKVKEELSAMPRIHVSSSEPENSKEGDIWIKT
ncbi:hypothetical protein [Rheinheimera sp.]|uniref:hypothetical protein n=1 Tax=Rheinheimera sp. TaxID=1869214 RepID=UPI0027328843|nr:hypothetical protein [Rheinheimera sp.]MDP2714530.1 hypothetical protein [Rheinheimera sp.]